ncbi:MAG: hypothetical protein BWX69_03188 [Planctomycetes bacterium ADurb.Bin069]|nr:MAG: hypothetical protein BWX69_03188 [Planctomycetes bacterium ADurb.Bin069]
MANEEVRINLTSSADTSGVDKMGAAVGGIAGDSRKAAAGLGDSAKASKALGSALGKSVEVGGAATSLMTNLATASQGGAAGFFAAGRAILSFGQIVKGVLLGAGPVGIAVAAIGLLAGAVFALKDAFKPAGESVDAFKKRIEDLDKANLRTLDATLSALSDRLKGAKEEADAVRASLDKIDDAEMAAKLAAVKASDLTQKQKDEQEFLIRDEFKQRRTSRERDALEQSAAAARETRDALAPEFEDARQKYGDLLNQADIYRTLERERDRLQREISGFGEDGRSNFDYGKANRIQQIERNLLPGKSDRAKFDAELASARNRFQGDDGKGGIAAQYQAAVKESEKAERALSRFNDTLAKVAEWDRSRSRLENQGVDPREAEAAARRSPGRARIVGPDGRVNEYDVQAAPTLNQQIAATADAARRGSITMTDGTIVPINRAQPGAGGGTITGPGGISRTFAPGAAQGPGRGAYREGGDDAASAIKGATEAVKGSDTGDATAKAAAELKAAEEQRAAAVQASTEQTVSALGDIISMSQETASVLGKHTSDIASLRAEIQSLRASVRAANRK